MSKIFKAASLQIVSTPIKSQLISAVEYIVSTKQLGVEFASGKQYVYEGVTPAEYTELVNAQSVGQYFNENIRDVKTFNKL